MSHGYVDVLDDDQTYALPAVTEIMCACCELRPGSHNALQLCGWCRRVYYCGPRCQKVHWPVHKLSCKKRKERETPADDAPSKTNEVFTQLVYGEASPPRMKGAISQCRFVDAKLDASNFSQGFDPSYSYSGNPSPKLKEGVGGGMTPPVQQEPKSTVMTQRQQPSTQPDWKQPSPPPKASPTSLPPTQLRPAVPAAKPSWQGQSQQSPRAMLGINKEPVPEHVVSVLDAPFESEVLFVLGRPGAGVTSALQTLVKKWDCIPNEYRPIRPQGATYIHVIEMRDICKQHDLGEEVLTGEAAVAIIEMQVHSLAKPGFNLFLVTGFPLTPDQWSAWTQPPMPVMSVLPCSILLDCDLQTALRRVVRRDWDLQHEALTNMQDNMLQSVLDQTISSPTLPATTPVEMVNWPAHEVRRHRFFEETTEAVLMAMQDARPGTMLVVDASNDQSMETLHEEVFVAVIEYIQSAVSLAPTGVVGPPAGPAPIAAAAAIEDGSLSLAARKALLLK